MVDAVGSTTLANACSQVKRHGAVALEDFNTQLAIRNRLLRFVLELEEHAPEVTDAEYDTLYRASEGELDPVKRAALIIKLNDLVSGDAYITPLVAKPRISGVSHKLVAPLSGWDNIHWQLAAWYHALGQSLEARVTLAASGRDAELLGSLAELEALAPYIEMGLVVLEPGAVQVTAKGWFFVRAIAMVFDRHLQADRVRERFSRII